MFRFGRRRAPRSNRFGNRLSGLGNRAVAGDGHYAQEGGDLTQYETAALAFIRPSRARQLTAGGDRLAELAGAHGRSRKRRFAAGVAQENPGFVRMLAFVAKGGSSTSSSAARGTFARRDQTGGGAADGSVQTHAERGASEVDPGEENELAWEMRATAAPGRRDGRNAGGRGSARGIRGGRRLDSERAAPIRECSTTWPPGCSRRKETGTLRERRAPADRGAPSAETVVE